MTSIYGLKDHPISQRTDRLKNIYMAQPSQLHPTCYMSQITAMVLTTRKSYIIL